MTKPRTASDRVLLRTRIEEMSAAAAVERIGRQQYQSLLTRDPHPMFVELLAGHEGFSTGAMSPARSRKRPARKFWTRDMVRELAARLRPRTGAVRSGNSEGVPVPMGQGVPVYADHGQSFRVPVGEILASAERWVEGVLGACGLAYIHDPGTRTRIRTGELDVCSIEAEIECHREKRGPEPTWIVDAVRKVTGVALGNSRAHRPGFPKAAVLAAVEEFSDGPAPTGDDDQPGSRPQPQEPKTDDPAPEPAPLQLRGDGLARHAELIARIEAAEKRLTEICRLLESRPNSDPRNNPAADPTADRKEEFNGRSQPPRGTRAQYRIPSPPEREGHPTLDNPLIPRPRGKPR